MIGTFLIYNWQWVLLGVAAFFFGLDILDRRRDRD